MDSATGTHAGITAGGNGHFRGMWSSKNDLARFRTLAFRLLRNIMGLCYPLFPPVCRPTPSTIMKRVFALYRRVQPAIYLILVWCAMAAPVLAKPKKGAEEASGPTGPSAWVLPYALVLFSVGLGMMMILRSARRSERHRPEQYGQQSE